MKRRINIVRVVARVLDSNPVEIPDFVSVTLPSIENLMETIRGAGIIGEIEVPTTAAVGPLTLTLASKSCEGMTILLAPGIHKVEIVWVRDVFDTGGSKIGLSQEKAIASGFTKKLDEGSIEHNAGQDVNVEMTCNTYNRYTDGKAFFELDKTNGVYKVDGKDRMSAIMALLK